MEESIHYFKNKKEAKKHICERLKSLKRALFYQLNKIERGKKLSLTYKTQFIYKD